jgi:aspartyl/glutamyl-tRNA(Asn/Gln) amidotransferase C subunit
MSSLIDVDHLADLADLSLSPKQKSQLAQELEQTLAYVSQVKTVDTQDLEITSRLTQEVNVTRTDMVDAQRILSQTQALSGTKNTYHGYFVVEPVL